MVKHKTDKTEMSRRTLYMHEDTSCAYDKYPPQPRSAIHIHTCICTPYCCSTYRPENTHVHAK